MATTPPPTSTSLNHKADPPHPSPDAAGPRQPITPAQTLRQLIKAWPACASVLERYPAARCNGQWSLQELAPFARDCGLDQASFLHHLADTAGTTVSPPRPEPWGKSPALLVFVAIGLGITLGATWGVGLLLRIALAVDYHVVPAASVHIHGMAQLWGWMALFIFAIASHQLRQNSRRASPRWLDRVTGAAIVAGILLFVGGPFSPWPGRWNVIGSGCLALAAGGFVTSVAWSLWGRGQRPQLWHWFVIAMAAWLCLWAGVDLATRWRSTAHAVPSDAARHLLIAVAVLGFATNAVYGFGLRLIPGLLNIGRLRLRAVSVTWLLHNVGVALFLSPRREISATGAVLMLAAACAYLGGLDWLRSKPARPIHGVDVRGHVLIRIAFFWLIAALTMIVIQKLIPNLPPPYTGAWRHALTVGFISTLILGVGQRIVPVMIKQPLWSFRLMLTGGALISIGCAGRVSLELLTMTHQPWTFRLMGVTGLFELTALVLFGVNLARTWLARRREYQAGAPLTADTRVREAVNELPALQQRFGELGITMFDQAPFIAPSMTFGALALATGRSPARLLAEVADVRPQRSACTTNPSDPDSVRQ